jgi:hypothetical protein
VTHASEVSIMSERDLLFYWELTMTETIDINITLLLIFNLLQYIID